MDEASQQPAPEARLAEEVRLRRFTEHVLDCRQEEVESLEIENKTLSKKLELLKKELSVAHSQLVEARNQSKAKTKQLQDARDQIFRLQPRRKDITESEAQEIYKSLCGNVQRWVENRLPPILDDLESGRLRSRPAGAQASRFASLIREPAKRCLSAHQSDEHHVIAVIMYYLWLVFFAKSFYCPLDGSDDATLTWIDDLESTMSKLPRDPAHCREWRSETLTALTSRPVFNAQRSAYVAAVSEDLTALLSTVVPKAPVAEIQTSLRRTIVEPAADFAHRLHLASNIYSLKWPARNAGSRLEVYECINLASGGLVLDLNGTGPTSPARRRVSYLFDLAPGLFVERVEVGRKAPLKAIYRPNVLVYSGDTDVPQKPTLMNWLIDNSNSQNSSSRNPFPGTATPRSKALPSPLLSKL